jgi:hypothetical protein
MLALRTTIIYPTRGLDNHPSQAAKNSDWASLAGFCRLAMPEIKQLRRHN